MVIFHSYVNLPEGMWTQTNIIWYSMIPLQAAPAGPSVSVAGWMLGWLHSSYRGARCSRAGRTMWDLIPRALEQTSGMGGTTMWMMVAGCLTWKVLAGSSPLLAAHGEWPDSSTAQTWYWGSAQGRLWGCCRTDVAACWQARLQDTEYDLYILRPEEGLVVGRLRKGLFPFR